MAATAKKQNSHEDSAVRINQILRFCRSIQRSDNSAQYRFSYKKFNDSKYNGITNDGMDDEAKFNKGKASFRAWWR